MKQVKNFKFYDIDNKKRTMDGREVNQVNEVKVVLPSGEVNYMKKKDADILYMRLYIAKNLDKVVEECLKKVGLTVKNAHLSDYKKLKEFENVLERAVRSEKMDLSFQDRVLTDKLYLSVTGNALGIVSEVLKQLWRHPWKEFQVTKEELKKYLKDNPKISVYRKGEYYSVVKIDKSELFKTECGKKFENQGIGSCASVREVTIELKKDEYGNILIEKNVMIWD